MQRHWLRGGFPLSFTARTDGDSFIWRRQFLQTFLERDLPQLGVGVPAAALHRFWTMVAHYHGQTWNGAELARALAISETTVRRYLDLMTGVFMVRQLQPWFENIGKRQVKAPKVYVRDSGLLHALLGLATRRDLEHHPKVGASWEGYALEEVLKARRPDAAPTSGAPTAAPSSTCCCSSVAGASVSSSSAPTRPRSRGRCRWRCQNLALAHLFVVYPGPRGYSLGKRVSVVPLAEFVNARASGPRPGSANHSRSIGSGHGFSERQQSIDPL